MSRRRSFGKSRPTLVVPNFLKVRDTKSGLTAEIKAALPEFSSVDRVAFRKVLQSVVQYTKGENIRKVIMSNLPKPLIWKGKSLESYSQLHS